MLDFLGAGGGEVEVELSPVLSFLRDTPQQMSLSFLPIGEEGSQDENEQGESKDGGDGMKLDRMLSGSVDFSVSVESSQVNYDFGTNQSITQRLQKACKKLITEQKLATDIGVTSDFASSVLRVMAKMDGSDQDGDSLVATTDDDHSDLNSLTSLVTGNMDIFPQSSDEMSQCSDVHCEHHDVDSELHDEVSGTVLLCCTVDKLCHTYHINMLYSCKL
jgi:hypothetical protein